MEISISQMKMVEEKQKERTSNKVMVNLSAREG
jgi:hypothetical protein